LPNSTKLIGRLGWTNQFEPWVQDTFHTNCNNFDEHPCCFQYICDQPFADNENYRRALHLSHNCHKELVDFIYFKTWLPEDDNAGDYVQHADGNGSCVVKDGEFECTTILSDPKTGVDRGTGKDDAWLLPEEYNDGDYPWWYSYNVYFKGDDVVINAQPDSELPATEG